jgi:hypothetical protein
VSAEKIFEQRHSHVELVLASVFICSGAHPRRSDLHRVYDRIGDGRAVYRDGDELRIGSLKDEIYPSAPALACPSGSTAAPVAILDNGKTNAI